MFGNCEVIILCLPLPFHFFLHFYGNSRWRKTSSERPRQKWNVIFNVFPSKKFQQKKIVNILTCGADYLMYAIFVFFWFSNHFSADFLSPTHTEPLFWIHFSRDNCRLLTLQTENKHRGRNTRRNYVRLRDADTLHNRIPYQFIQQCGQQFRYALLEIQIENKYEEKSRAICAKCLFLLHKVQRSFRALFLLSVCENSIFTTASHFMPPSTKNPFFIAIIS